jgi:tripartite-type tricarboxylate transporter receptor subunit TctC
MMDELHHPKPRQRYLRRVSRCLAAVTAAVTMMTSAGVLAQAYPSKPIRIIVPYPPGGTADVTSRILGKRLSEELGQPVLVENRPGAGGGIALQLAAKSPPDGYTLVQGNPGTNAINPALYPNLGYNPETDFTPIGVVVTAPLFLVVSATSRIRTVRDLIALGTSKNTGALTFGSSGNGAPSHLGGEMFNTASGTSFVHVPYKGASPLTVALLSGEVHWAFLPGPDAIPQFRGGKMRPIAVAGSKRSPLSPDTPTLNESGFTDFDLSLWYGLLAPARTPQPIVDLLHQKLAKILGEAEIRTKLHDLSAEPSLNTPEEFAALIRTEIEKYARAVKASGAKVE